METIISTGKACATLTRAWNEDILELHIPVHPKNYHHSVFFPGTSLFSPSQSVIYPYSSFKAIKCLTCIHSFKPPSILFLCLIPPIPPALHTWAMFG